jgi:peptide/nickel transport system substrate-binding protein
MAINLPMIAETYYGGDADPSPLPLTSNYMTGWGFPYSQWPQDYKDQYTFNTTGAKQLLAQAGYTNGFNTDIVIDATVDINLVQIIQSEFSSIGVNMSIQVMQSAALTSFVNSHSEDAMAERVPGTSTLGLSSYPLRHFNRFLAGSSPNIELVNDPLMQSLYTQSMAATSSDVVKTLLIQANKQVITQHYDISLLSPDMFGFCQPWLKGYKAQVSAVSGTAGPLMLFFWGARYWIDQD